MTKTIDLKIICILNYILHYLPLLHCQSSSNNEHTILTNILIKSFNFIICLFKKLGSERFV